MIETINSIFDFNGAVASVGVIIATYSLRNLEWRINLSAKPLIIQNLWWILGYLGFITLALSKTFSGLNSFWVIFCIIVGLYLIFKSCNSHFFYKRIIERLWQFIKERQLATLFLISIILFVVFNKNEFHYFTVNQLIALKENSHVLLTQTNLEIISVILFILAPISFMLPALSTQNLFKGSNKENVFNILFEIATSKNTDAFKYATNIFVDNLELIFKDISNNSKNDEWAKRIFEIVLTESEYLNYLVESRIDFLENFFFFVKKYKITDNWIQNTHQKLFFKLFTNQGSYLYRHLDYSGEGMVRSMYRIFEDIRIVRNFSPFPQDLDISLLDRDNFNNTKFLKVISKSTLLALKTVWSHNINSNNGITQAFRIIESEARKACWDYPQNKTSYKDDRLISSISRLILNKIPDTFSENYEKLDFSNFNLDDISEHTHRGSLGYQTDSLTEVWANLYLSFFDSLSRVSNEMFDYRLYIFRESIFCTLYQDNKSFDFLRKIVQKKIWHSIYNHDLHGLYGSVSRIYITAVFWEPSKNDPKWLLDEYKKIYEFLYKELRPRFLDNAVMADGAPMIKSMLPNIIEFKPDEKLNGSKGTFYLKFAQSYDKKPKMLIEDLDTVLKKQEVKSKGA